jgi:hypothetical protein
LAAIGRFSPKRRRVHLPPTVGQHRYVM